METFSYKAVDASGKDVKGAIEAESKDEAFHIFNGLSEGANVEIPLAENPGDLILLCFEISMELSGW